MKSKQERPNLRRDLIRAAEEANVPPTDLDRAKVLGQVAGLLAAHPKVGGRIAFKGGAVMHLIDGSPRLSRDLDGVMVVGQRVTEAIVREALTTPRARKIVMGFERFSMIGKEGLTFGLITCHPISGIDRVTIQLRHSNAIT